MDVGHEVPFGEQVQLGDRLQRLRTLRRTAEGKPWTLEEVYKRSGLAVGYLSQLEKGSKLNPSLNALKSLAKAFDCPVGLLLGEYDLSQVDLAQVSPRAFAIGTRFSKHVAGLPEAKRWRLSAMDVAERFEFVCDTLSGVVGITRTVVAWCLGNVMRSHNDALIVGPGVAELGQLVRHFGIPAEFVLSGELPAPGQAVDPAILLKYGGAAVAAKRANISPERLLQLIQAEAERLAQDVS